MCSELAEAPVSGWCHVGIHSGLYPRFWGPWAGVVRVSPLLSSLSPWRTCRGVSPCNGFSCTFCIWQSCACGGADSGIPCGKQTVGATAEHQGPGCPRRQGCRSEGRCMKGDSASRTGRGGRQLPSLSRQRKSRPASGVHPPHSLFSPDPDTSQSASVVCAGLAREPLRASAMAISPPQVLVSVCARRPTKRGQRGAWREVERLATPHERAGRGRRRQRQQRVFTAPGLCRCVGERGVSREVKVVPLCGSAQARCKPGAS